MRLVNFPKLPIPRISGDPLSIPLEAGDQLFVVGANGSGKSALIQYLYNALPRRIDSWPRRIPAHRQTWLRSGSSSFTARTRLEFNGTFQHYESQFDARWTDHIASETQEAILFDLTAQAGDRAEEAMRHLDNFVNDPQYLQDPEGAIRTSPELKEAIRIAVESASPFRQLNELLALGTLAVSLENSRSEGILARHGNGSAIFGIEKMSDGERSAAIMAATVLTVAPGTVLLIDEPERHLHRAIIEPFLSALFRQRKDCAFVISTYEIALPIANPGARVLMVRSCEWQGDTAKAWEVELLESNVPLPEDLKRDILGARRRILFVEGTTTCSLDQPLYDALFPDLLVIPKGGCVDVQRAVEGLRRSRELHHVEAFGLIDKDDRPEDNVAELARKGVFAPDVCSVEALYYCSDVMEAVAHRQAESLGCDANEMIESAKQKALSELQQSDLAERMAARRCERRVRNQMLSKLPDWKSIRTNANPKISTCIDSPYTKELGRFKKLVSEGKLDDLVTRYPLRDSGVLGKIAKALRYQTKGDYEKTVVTRIRKDDGLAQKLKGRIGPLSDALAK